MAYGNNTLTISSATVRVQDGKTHIDAIVNGEEQESFVFYDGDSNDHVTAAYQYLSSCGLFNSEIAFVQYDDDDWDANCDAVIDAWINERVEPHITF